MRSVREKHGANSDLFGRSANPYARLPQIRPGDRSPRGTHPGGRRTAVSRLKPIALDGIDLFSGRYVVEFILRMCEP